MRHVALMWPQRMLTHQTKEFEKRPTRNSVSRQQLVVDNEMLSGNRTDALACSCWVFIRYLRHVSVCFEQTVFATRADRQFCILGAHVVILAVKARAIVCDHCVFRSTHGAAGGGDSRGRQQDPTRSCQ